VVVCGITEEVDRVMKIAAAATATVGATVPKIIVASPSAKI
jgi:hypothetical protein